MKNKTHNDAVFKNVYMAGKALHTFSRGEKVVFTDPEKGRIAGEVFRVAAYGELQYLLIYGVNEKGSLVKACCYNDNTNLKKES